MNRQWLLRISGVLWVGLVLIVVRHAHSADTSTSSFRLGIGLLVLGAMNLVIGGVVVAKEYRVAHFCLGVIPSGLFGLAALHRAFLGSVSTLDLSLGLGAIASVVIGARLVRRMRGQQKEEPPPDTTGV